MISRRIGNLSEKEFKEFNLWAFGKEYPKYSLKNVPKYWNKRHGDKLYLTSEGTFRDDVNKMINLWKKEKLRV